VSLAKLLRHLGVVADHGLPDIPWLKATSERLIDRLASQLRVDDVTGVGIRIRKVFRQAEAKFGNTHG